jgi:hypothetical protein
MKRTNASWVLATLAILFAAESSFASPTLDAVVACRKGVTKFGQLYAHKRRVLLLNCADKLVKCDIQQELDGMNPNGCRSKAKTYCEAKLGSAVDTPLSRHRTRFHDKASLACSVAMYFGILSNGAGGLWYSNDVNCGASVDLPTLIDCVRDQWLDVETDTLVGQLKPRAGLLLDNIDLGADFPNLPRPPIFPVVVSAAMAGGGDVVNPGTISPGAGTAVRFSGDDTTLPCGMSSNNGKLTITIVPFGDMCNATPIQEGQVKEPYGTTRTATFGPYLTDVTYCLHLQDGGMGCQDDETGTIDVP